MCLSDNMSLETLKETAAALDAQSRKELVAFLIGLREAERADHIRKMSAILDDPDPSRWLTIEELKARLELIPEPAED